MATNRDIIQRAFRRIGYSNATETEYSEALTDFKGMVYQLEGGLGPLGYHDNSTIDQDTGMDQRYNEGLVSMLAMLLAEVFDLATTPRLSASAAAGIAAIRKLSALPINWKHPNRMPTGSGNQRQPYQDRNRYYRETLNQRVIDHAILIDGSYITLNGSYMTIGVP